MVVSALGMAVAALLWPFNMYFPRLRLVPRVCGAISKGFDFLLSHLGRILEDERGEELERWESVVQLVCVNLLTWRPLPSALTIPY